LDEKNDTKRISYRAHPDWEGYDEITIKVVPRYKTSGLSGDEWRIHAVLTVKRKGEVVLERPFHDIERAMKYLPWVVEVEMVENGTHKRGLFGHYEDEYAQPGCAEKPVNHYRLKKLYTKRGEGPLPDSDFTEYRRAFCARHSTRGDCGLEDADSNYELIDGPGFRKVDPKDIRESRFGGVIEMKDLTPENLKKLTEEKPEA